MKQLKLTQIQEPYIAHRDNRVVFVAVAENSINKNDIYSIRWEIENVEPQNIVDMCDWDEFKVYRYCGTDAISKLYTGAIITVTNLHKPTNNDTDYLKFAKSLLTNLEKVA